MDAFVTHVPTQHAPAPPFACSNGPHNARIALVGEAFGEQEDLLKRPFVGASGQELTRMLSDAGISRRECFLTNVFAFRPQGNDIATLCGGKKEVRESYAQLCPGTNYDLAHLGKTGQYLRPEYLGELSRLAEELQAVRPHVCIALGATACWALLGSNRIGALRGTVATSTLVPGLKVLPTYHPAAVLRNWAYRPITIADLLKSKRESESPHIARPERFILVEPTMDELCDWTHAHITLPCEVACDIETKSGMIEMIGFSSGPQHAMVVPFVDRAKGGNYWPTRSEELEARRIVASILHNPRVYKVFQNGLYDLQYLLREGFRPRNCTHDTMLLHHSIYPELQKGLGFLGSIYTNEPAWKLMRGAKQTEMKKDD